MKILIVQDTDWIRRNPINHTHLSERLSLKGHDVRVIDYEILWHSEGKKELFSRRQVFHVSRLIKGANITVIRPGILKVPLFDYLSMLYTYNKEIGQQINDFKPDIVIGNDILTPLLAYGKAKRKNIPTIFYAIDIEHKLVPYKFLQALAKMVESKNIKDADLVLAINESLLDYTIRMGASQEKARVLRMGIDPEKFNRSVDGDEIRVKYNIRKDEKVLFFMGWLYHFSGMKEVAYALHQLDDRAIKLMIVGDGDAYDELCEICEKYGMSDRIFLTGKIPFNELPKYIAAADICLLPAYNNEIMKDIVPIKLYEYMAMSKPIISTRLQGVMKEFGENNGIVYIDRPEHTIEMAVKMFKNGVLSEGEKARKFVEKNDWDTITKEYEQVLVEVVSRKGSRVDNHNQGE